ncbi:hypothetical protein RB195_017881 [Necator americanus]|uniref:Reverse transcriptase domain-containing protein n=1 Tax=Necator americanus TaxID=51031 RepID=A0ABR1C783_NECAM
MLFAPIEFQESDMKRRTTAAIRTPAGYSTQFKVEAGQRPTDVILALFGLPLVDLEYTDDVAVFASSSAKLQHVVNLASKLAAAYGMRSALINVSSCGSPRDPPREIRVDGQPIELVDEFCYLGCMVKTMAAIKGKYSAKMRLSYFGIQLIQDASLVNYANEVKLQVYLSAVRPIIMYGSERGSAGDGNGKA